MTDIGLEAPQILMRSLESACREAERSGQFEIQQQLFQQMIELVETNLAKFNEASDRISILKSRMLVAEFRRVRLYGGKKIVELHNEAAQWSTPSACLQTICSSDPSNCINYGSRLTPLQKGMCFFRINHLIESRKFSAAFFATRGDVSNAVLHRREAVKLGKQSALVNSASTSQLDYLEYWLNISEGGLAIQEARFDDAKRHFALALALGRRLDTRKCFPNYFIDLQEIAAHECYIDALASVQKGRWETAAESFSRWLEIRSNAKGTLRFDNFSIFEKICTILCKFPTAAVSRDAWREIERLLENSHVARTTWVLWWKLNEVRFNSVDTMRRLSRIQIDHLLENISENWPLFVPDTPLLGSDRSASLERPVVIPTFLNMLSELDNKRDNWGRILQLNFRHLLLLMAEYEQLRCSAPPPEEEHLAKLHELPVVDTTLSTPVLLRIIKKYLERRSNSHLKIFEKAIQLLPKFDDALASKDFKSAMETQKAIFEIIRSWPHTIKVISQEKISACTFADESAPGLLTFLTQTERLWNKEPKNLTFEGPKSLETGAYYYLRPKWNIRNNDYYRTRHEHFYQTNIPQLLEVFNQNIFASSFVTSDQFRDWILQFRDEEILTCCKLFSALRIYDKKKIIETWKKVYRQISAEILNGLNTKKTAIVRLGHGAKSGSLNSYNFRQAISEIPEYEFFFRGNEKNIFRDLSEYSSESLKLQLPENIIFLDDFIGSGGQATDFINWYPSRYPWILKAHIRLAVISGYESAITEVQNKIRDAYPGLDFEIIVGDKLTDDVDRAFSSSNRLWESEAECKFAEQWANNIGKELLETLPGHKELGYVPERDSLGWKGTQALVAFAHNVPSNTLPIFWASGIRDGVKWIPLLERYD